MAQTLKDEIRERILKAALHEFYANGYQSATMRNIANRAKIPAGLIYSYYKNKGSLFDGVLRPVRYDWVQVLNAGGGHHQGPGNKLSNAEMGCILSLFSHRKEFIIMMDKSSGTPYENEKEKMVSVIEGHLNGSSSIRLSCDPVFIHIVANNFVDGLLQIMYHYKDQEWAMMILNRLTQMYFSGIGY